MEKNILYFINEEIFVITLSFFLTKFKYATANRNFYINYKKISVATNTSIKYAKKITHYYQKMVSAYSCRFVDQISHEIVQQNELSNIIQHLRYFDDDCRSVLPCYLATKIILLHMRKNRVPIILTIHRFSQLTQIDSITLYFESDPIHNFIPAKVPDHTNIDNQIAMHIDGITNYDAVNFESRKQFIDRLQEAGLMKIILANMAVHPQYPGTTLSHLSHNPYSIECCSRKALDLDINMQSLKKLEEEFLYMKHVGQQLGCTLENPSLFLIEHISCGMILEILNQGTYDKTLESIEPI